MFGLVVEKLLGGKTSSPHRRHHDRRTSKTRPVLEPLEGRQLLSALAAEFPGHGVWRFEDSTGWRQLTPANATQVAVGSDGNVAAEFPGQGVWRFEDSTGWRQLTPADAKILDMKSNGNVAADFLGQVSALSKTRPGGGN